MTVLTIALTVLGLIYVGGAIVCLIAVHDAEERTDDIDGPYNRDDYFPHDWRDDYPPQ